MTEEDITHLGITYSVTHSATVSKTPLETCLECDGTGLLYTRKCKHCGGRGLAVRDTPVRRNDFDGK